MNRIENVGRIWRGVLDMLTGVLLSCSAKNTGLIKRRMLENIKNKNRKKVSL
jgi:hypothetical protein